MAGRGVQEIIGAAEAAVDRWRDRVDEVEVYLLRQTGRSVSAERDRIVRGSASADVGAGVRVVAGGRLGFSYCTDMSDLDAAVERAIALAPLGQEVDGLFPRVRPANVPGLRSRPVEMMTVEDLRDATAAMLDRARELDPEASVVSAGTGASVEEVAIANTSGPARHFTGTYFSVGLSVLFRTDPPATGFEHAVSRSDDIDPHLVAGKAVEMARMSRDPIRREGGVPPIVLRHDSLSDVLEFTLFPALVAERALEGRSMLSERVGDVVASDLLTLTDRQVMPAGCGASPFDDEGSRSRDLPLIRNGALVGYLHSLSTAARHGAEPTGSALRCERWSSSRSYRSTPAAVARNVWIEPTVEDAVAEVEDGVLVVAVMGAHTSNPVSGDFSLNTNVAFEITGGEVGRALKPMMLSGNVMDLLRGVSAVGSDLTYHSGAMSGVGGYIPSIAVEGLTLTS